MELYYGMTINRKVHDSQIVTHIISYDFDGNCLIVCIA